MRVHNLKFSNALIEFIRETLHVEPTISRTELSQRVCERENWRSLNGKLKEMSCRKALLELDRRGIIDLPSLSKTYSFDKPAESVLCIEVPELTCSLDELGEVALQPIESRYKHESKVWRSLVETHHYLGAQLLCGAQIRYLVESSKYGPIGALAFSPASWALAARGKFIGWTESARRTNLDKVVLNARFLIVPSVKVPNLASHVLSLTIKRLADDWEERYAVRPVLVETFVDPTRFDGTCYKAANWEYVGDTSGRRDGIPKHIFLRPLQSDWQETLCFEPSFSLGDGQPIENPANWAEEELGTVRIFDPRLKRRLFTIAQKFYDNCGKTIPEACGSRAETVGTYRFFDNKETSMEVILTAHTEATIERMKNYSVVLAPQDTTVLEYNTRPMTEGLGPTNGTQGGLGLILHDTMAFTEDGTPLGILDAQCWARDPKKIGEVKHKRGQLPIEQKESMKWLRSFQKLSEIQRLCPNTMLVSIGDREADIYELFFEATKEPNGPKLLVRSERTRGRKVENEALWDYMPKLNVAGKVKLHISRSDSQKARDAWVDIRFAKVELSPPKKLSHEPPITAWAVYVKEQANDENVDSTANPIEWMLQTTASVITFGDAVKRIEWYSGRWGIEIYHRTLKSGCCIGDRQLGTAENLETCIGIDMVVAWRIYHLTMLGREKPDAPCTVFFDDIEWKALCCYANKTPTPPDKPPTLAEAIRLVGKIGGHQGRRRDGPPGTQVIWRGIQRLETAAEMYAIMSGSSSP